MTNAKLGTKAVGSIVKLKVNGTAKEFIVVHQGKPSSIYDESCNGTWLLMKDIYENRVWNRAGMNKYESSEINTYLNDPFLNLFDSDIMDAIKQVKIPYRQYGGSGGIDQSGANGLSAKIFLLSGYEVGWTTNDSPNFPVDGAKLDYFESGTGSSANNKRIAKLNGSAADWWLRSPFPSDFDHVFYVLSNGKFEAQFTYAPYGIRPALVLPQDMGVDSSGNVTPPPPPATHKTLVNGTAYEVTGGKCLVNGTAYSIQKGRTLIGGTGYDVTLPEEGPDIWYFNDAITMPSEDARPSSSSIFGGNFACDGVYYRWIRQTVRSDYVWMISYLKEDPNHPNDPNYAAETIVYYNLTNWENQKYRTIEIEKGGYIVSKAWLQANATLQ